MKKVAQGNLNSPRTFPQGRGKAFREDIGVKPTFERQTP
jgi:hypothetical protein